MGKASRQALHTSAVVSFCSSAPWHLGQAKRWNKGEFITYSSIIYALIYSLDHARVNIIEKVTIVVQAGVFFE